jgi:elongation factor G
LSWKEFLSPNRDFVAIEPKNSGCTRINWGNALAENLSEEDPTFKVRVDENTGTNPSFPAWANFTWKSWLNRMSANFNVEGQRLETPRVSFRETFTKSVPKVDYKYAKQTGGHGQYRARAVF